MIVFIKKYWKTLLWFTAITLASLVKKIPVEAPKFELVGFDKLVHFIFYATLSFLIFYEGYRTEKSKFSLYWILVFPVAYGGLIELIQGAMVSPRSAEWGDFVADALGSLCVVAIIKLVLYRRNHYSKLKRKI